MADPAVVVDARQVKRPRGVIEVEPDSSVCIEPERSDRRHLSGVFVDCEEPVAKDIDAEHATDWIDSDTNNCHALGNAEKATDYRCHHFVAPVDAGQKEVCVAKSREIVCANSVKRISSRVPRHPPPSLDLRRALHPAHIDRRLAGRRIDGEEVLATVIDTEMLSEVVSNKRPSENISSVQRSDLIGIARIGNVVEPLVQGRERRHGELVSDGKGARGEDIGLVACPAQHD